MTKPNIPKVIQVMKTIDDPRAIRRLTAGTKVVSKEDGELGRIVRVSTARRNGIDAWSYVIDTNYGRETWDAGDLFVPQS